MCPSIVWCRCIVPRKAIVLIQIEKCSIDPRTRSYNDIDQIHWIWTLRFGVIDDATTADMERGSTTICVEGANNVMCVQKYPVLLAVIQSSLQCLNVHKFTVFPAYFVSTLQVGHLSTDGSLSQTKIPQQHGITTSNFNDSTTNSAKMISLPQVRKGIPLSPASRTTGETINHGTRFFNPFRCFLISFCTHQTQPVVTSKSNCSFAWWIYFTLLLSSSTVRFLYYTLDDIASMITEWI